jgi:hypothetical protein
MTGKIMVILALILLAGCSSTNYDSFAQCLTEKGAIMYGTDWCGYCNQQKGAFGSSFQYVDFVDCDNDMGACSQANIGSYPTWVINGNQYRGEQSLSRLAYLTGCNLS